MSDLLARLQQLAAPDRDTDGDVMFSLFAQPVGENGFLWPEDNPSWVFAMRFPGKDRPWFDRARRGIGNETILVWRDGDPILMNDLRVPPLTRDLQQAVNITEKTLPGAWYLIGKGKTRADEPLYGAQIMFGSDEVLGSGEHDTNPAIALLIALFAALAERAKGGGK